MQALVRLLVQTIFTLSIASTAMLSADFPAVITAKGAPLDLIKLSHERPVIVVRYLGYRCEHCVRQILLLNRNATKIKAHNAVVIGVSNDPVEKNFTAETELGLDTSVVHLTSDNNGTFARGIGASIEEPDSTITELHVTLVIKDGKIVFEKFGTAPYMDVERVIATLDEKKR